VKTWLPAGTLSDAVQIYAPGTVGLGGQLGNDSVRFTTAGFAPSVRICNERVLGETYFGVIRPAFIFGWIPIANVTFPFAAFVESAPFVDCAGNTELCDWGRIAEVPTTAPPPQPATMAAHSPTANTPQMRFVKKVMRTPLLIVGTREIRVPRCE
jgi:hypothetical protein